MINLENIASLVSAIGGFLWPILAIIFVVLFRTQIRALIDRIRGIKTKFFEFLSQPADVLGNLGDSRIAFSFVTPTRDNTNPCSYEWTNRTKNLFWVGHDLMYAKAMLLVGASGSNFFFGIRQSLKHMNELGFSKGSRIFDLILRLNSDAEKMMEHEWTAEKRESYARTVQEIIYGLGFLTQDYQEIKLKKL